MSSLPTELQSPPIENFLATVLNAVCMYALILFLPSSEEEFAYALETSTINVALLSHQWSKVCTQYTMPGDRNSIAYSYVHIVLALLLPGVTVGYYLRIFALCPVLNRCRGFTFKL